MSGILSKGRGKTRYEKLQWALSMAQSHQRSYEDLAKKKLKASWKAKSIKTMDKLNAEYLSAKKKAERYAKAARKLYKLLLKAKP